MTQLVETGVYFGVAAILLWAAATDLKARRIPNVQPLLITGLFGILATVQLLAGGSFMATVGMPFFSAFIVFAFTAILFALNAMGGGDVKLMTATALVAGPSLSLAFVFFVAIAGGVVALATLVHAGMNAQAVPAPAIEMPEEETTAPKVPYGIAIMMGGIWVCFQKIAAVTA